MKKAATLCSLLAAAGVATMLGSLVGCDVHEKFVYVSTPSVPQTVTLKDTSTGEQVWSYDVPPGQELKLWFTNQPAQANSQGFDEMVWTVGTVGAGVPMNTNRLRVPPPMSRRIDGGVRPPETQKASSMEKMPSDLPVPIVTPPTSGH